MSAKKVDANYEVVQEMTTTKNKKCGKKVK